ncbi:hypothetical protein chiPu_0030288, partial [Chiloscyllium punctatum]|nr:hypothetical protein [Chiloscyllium punctatum]
LSGVGELVHASDSTAAADEAVEVVARIVGPRSRELRDCLTHREAGELDEGVVDANRTACNRTGVRVVRGLNRADRGVNGRTVALAGVGIRSPRERRIEEGTDDTVFGRSTRIDVQVFTRAPGVAVGEPVVCTAGTRGVAGVIRVRVHDDVGAQVAAQLDTGVGARDVIETGTIQGANLHVLDRFGLDGKIGRLSSADRDECRRRAEDKALNHLHVKPPSCSISGKVPDPPGKTPS